ncbi:hypothetical protein LOTGIDRAFT_157143 [Lottia gigantea]|uniref:Uncharacterized protein n=1 Tax=Lottia gigantea TaxID=225164 RepID=V4B3P3_LOTGI|nr:hypothetical protein LOTGIDRAFT_157143 [Lottia gigantea]ESP02006.1 hypothetical protein LOTGIDRAFT_157143 [Lottia gigantea]
MAEATCSQKVKPSRECKRFALDDILDLLDDNDSDLELSDDNDSDYLEDPVDTIDNQSEDEDGGINNSNDDEEQLLAASREDETSADDSDYEPVVKRVALPIDYYCKAGAKHLPHAVALKSASRCRYPGCTSKTRVRRVRCDLFLCVQSDRNCFRMFHT